MAAGVPEVVPRHEPFVAEEVALVDVRRRVGAGRAEPEERGADCCGERAEDECVPPRERQSRGVATNGDLAGQTKNLTRAGRIGDRDGFRAEPDTPPVQDSGHVSPRRPGESSLERSRQHSLKDTARRDTTSVQDSGHASRGRSGTRWAMAHVQDSGHGPSG